MKHEYIGKVKLNYEFYNGNDLYTDGEDIEAELLNIAKTYENCEDALANDTRWPILYHFSPIRENIVEWYPFKRNTDILEVGAGCGAVTGGLIKNNTAVTCVELSKQRALINAHRHKNVDNIEIIVGNYNDISFDKQFDYVTLIGVLEYAKLYIDSAGDPYVDFLNKIKSHLKPSGELIIAIENMFGLKYWAGAKEDHTNLLFEGIEGYPNSHKIATFSKNSLIQVMQEAGFTKLEFYYPYPDYKMPHVIYSDRWLPGIDDLTNDSYNYDNERYTLFNEQNVYNNLIKNGMFDIFSNSFLVIAS